MGPADVGDQAEPVAGAGSPREVVLLEKWLDATGDALRLKGTRCGRCDRSFFPPKDFCPQCGGADALGNARIGPAAKVYAFTVARIAATGFPVPYAFGWVDFPEGIRFLARFDRHESLEIGMDVTMRLGKIREVGVTTHVGPVFTAAGGGTK